MRIGLYGIYGVYNLGCEAIVRGAVEFINNLYPDAKIIYFTYNYEYDSKILSDLPIELYRINHTKNVAKKMLNIVETQMKMNNRTLLFEYREIISQVDIIISIGGDIYTIPSVVRENKKYSYYNTLVDFCNKVILSGKKVILYGASVGPWGNYNKAVNYYCTNMKKYKWILCREQESENYLENFSFQNCSFFPDPAFQVRLEQEHMDEKKYIGINLSPLSFEEVYGTYKDKISDIAAVIDKVYEKNKRSIMFIPHVLSDHEKDNDLNFMKLIVSEMKYKEYVVFADYSEGFLGVKKSIRKCEVVVSARMHCAINSIVESVPTAFISYSQKSIGMCKYVYGNKDNLIGVRDYVLLPDVISRLLDDRIEIEKYLLKKIKEIECFYKVELKKVRAILES